MKYHSVVEIQNINRDSISDDQTLRKLAVQIIQETPFEELKKIFQFETVDTLFDKGSYTDPSYTRLRLQNCSEFRCLLEIK